MRVDARVLGTEALFWRVWDCARRVYREDVIYVDDGSNEYAIFNPSGSDSPLRIVSRVAIVAAIKNCYINLDADPKSERAPFVATNELIATRGGLCVTNKAA